MAAPRQRPEPAHFRVRNVGGIDESEVTVSPGVTLLTGENATNRTSFLQATMAAMGSDRATLKGDAEEGSVRMELGDRTYERELVRIGDSVCFSGEGYLDDPERADLFCFLLESNEARRSVALGGDLHEVIMRPVDTDAIEREIERLEDRKAEIGDEIDAIESRQRDLPGLEERRRDLRREIEEKREELAAKEAEIDASSRDVERSRTERDELEERLDELRSTRSELESTRREIERQRETVATLERERTEYEAELDELPETPTEDEGHREGELDRLRERRRSLNGEISELQNLVQYNEERLEEGGHELLGRPDDAVTDRLIEGGTESVVCWTCGSAVDREQIEDTVDRLGELRRRRLDELDEVKSALDELKADRREATRKRERREEIEDELEGVDDEIDRREGRIDSLEDRRDELTDEVERLEDAVDDLDAEEAEDVLSLHREANQLEFEIDRLESELGTVTTEIEAVEERIERTEALREERADVADELADERTRIERLEAEAVEAFNEHMDAVLEVLEYGNLARVWIERVEREVEEGRGTVERSAFELHVVRTTEGGTAYEDTVEHLSESEREVTGLVFALAGYLVHDLHESVPFVLLDSLEAIDSDRIAALVDYFAGYADYLVVALLPEDARALDATYDRVTDV